MNTKFSAEFSREKSLKHIFWKKLKIKSFLQNWFISALWIAQFSPQVSHSFYYLKTFHTGCTLHRKIWHSAGNKGLGHKADTTWQITKSFITVMATNLLNFIFTPPIQTLQKPFLAFWRIWMWKVSDFLGKLWAEKLSGFWFWWEGAREEVICRNQVRNGNKQ